MKILKTLVVASVALCLPIALGGQSYLDLGDIGAAHAKKGENGKSDNGKGGGKGASGKSDNSSKGASKSSKSQKSKSTKSSASKASSGASKSKGQGGLLKNIKKAFTSKKTTKKNVQHAQKAPKSKKKAAAATVATAAVAGGALNSQLKSLNSLNRNINGLMNSNDPKMEPFREFIAASADYEAAKDALAEAGSVLEVSAAAFAAVVESLEIEPSDPATMLAAYEALVVEHAGKVPGEAPVEPIAPDVDETDPLYQEYLSDLETWKQDMSDWEEAQIAWENGGQEAWEAEGEALAAVAPEAEQLETDLGLVEEAETKVAETEEAASRDAMKQAMADSLNQTGAGPVTVDDMTDPMADWVAEKLGVDEADGLIDDYRAMLPEPDATDSALPDEGTDDIAMDDPADDGVEGEEELILTTATE